MYKALGLSASNSPGTVPNAYYPSTQRLKNEEDLEFQSNPCGKVVQGQTALYETTPQKLKEPSNSPSIQEGTGRLGPSLRLATQTRSCPKIN